MMRTSGSIAFVARRLSSRSSDLPRDVLKSDSTDGVAEPSTQTVTVFREASPDLAVGEGTMADDDRWIPGDVYWRVETDRQQFTYSEINLHYTPDEVEGFDLQKVAVFYAKPNQTLTENTVWSWLPFTHDPERRVFTMKKRRSRNLTATTRWFRRTC